MSKIFIIFILFVSSLFANVGSVSELEGEVFAKRGTNEIRLKLSDEVQERDFILTKANSKVKITFSDNTIITIGKESTLDIAEYLFDGANSKTELSITKGAFHAITGQIGKLNPSKFRLKTKNASIGVRGTEIYGDQSRVFCTSGAINVESFGESRDVAAGNFVATFDDREPSGVMPITQGEFDDVDAKLNTTEATTQNTSQQMQDQPSEILSLPPQEQMQSEAVQDDNTQNWGYWASEVQDDKNVTNNAKDANESAQLAQGSSTYIQGLINSSQVTNLSYSGTILVDGSSEAHKNNINLNFHFGGQANTFGANYEYQKDANSTSFADNITGSASADGFFSTNSENGSSITHGKYEGSSAQSVAGDILMKNANNNMLDGSFNASQTTGGVVAPGGGVNPDIGGNGVVGG